MIVAAVMTLAIISLMLLVWLSLSCVVLSKSRVAHLSDEEIIKRLSLIGKIVHLPVVVVLYIMNYSGDFMFKKEDK